MQSLVMLLKTALDSFEDACMHQCWVYLLLPPC
jgi:hypothetical protein